MSNSRQPQYLTENDYPDFRIRCPIHGFIHFSENERKIIDHPIFQRLRYIRQLALTELIYPGATNTRFEHSLGVMEIATRSFDKLAAKDKNGELLEKNFKEVNGFEESTMAKARQVLRLAALLHDIGHPSFSHAAEKVVFENGTHEDFATELLRQGDIGKKIEEIFWQGCAESVAKIIEPLPGVPQFKVLRDLVSGEMDADRSDYLLRDSICCGVESGRFDYLRMIECLELYENDEGSLEIALNRDGIHTFEALILARYQMNTQVYYHRVRRIYDRYLEEYHKALGEECPKTPDEILANNDFTMMAKIKDDSLMAEGERKKWAELIFHRKHHRQIFETGYNADAKGIKNAKKTLNSLEEKYPDYEFIFDSASVTIHKQFLPGDQDDAGLIELMLVQKDKSPTPIAEISLILSKITRKFKCGRIFADVSPEDKTVRENMSRFANQTFDELGSRQ